MSFVPVPTTLLERDFNGYSEAAARRKRDLHRQGKKLLQALAAAIGLGPEDYDLRSNLGGVAVSGEVTLHAQHLYLQLSESCIAPGLTLLVRGCRSKKDYAGYANNFFGLCGLSGLSEPNGQQRAVNTMRSLMTQAQLMTKSTALS